MTPLDTFVEDSPKGFVLSFPITKIDAERREVWGYATTEELDAENEIVDYEGSVKAFEEWSGMMDRATGGKSLGNVREMHGPKAVGRVIAWKAIPEEKAIWVGAKLSESEDGEDAWKKVNEGVLNGFSIGSPVAERQIEYSHEAQKQVTRVKSYKLSELSLVDNPACPGSFFQEIKLAKSVKGGMMFFNGLGMMDDDAEPRGTEKVDRPPAEVQSLIFSKDRYKTEDQVKGWAKNNDFKAGDVDETEDSFRLRQKNPGDFIEGSFRTIDFKPGIQSVIGRLKEGKTAAAGGASGRFYICGSQTEKGKSMNVEKAGKRIGPQTRRTGTSPGAQVPETPALKPMETPPKPAKGNKAVDGLDVGKPGGPHEGASTKQPVPDGQGKAAPGTPEWAEQESHEPEHMGKMDPENVGKMEGEEGAGKMEGEEGAGKMEGEPPAEKMECELEAEKMEPEAEKMGEDGLKEMEGRGEHEKLQPEAGPGRYGFCAMCGSKFAQDSGEPVHEACKQEADVQDAAAKMAKIGVKGMAKAWRAQHDHISALRKSNQALEKRLKALEDMPTGGGPAKTALPGGVAAVEKGGASMSYDQAEQILEKSVKGIADPYERDVVRRHLTKAAIRRAQSGRSLP